ncbi:MAG: Rne/Rng family ribonuclease [Bauldia sp.]
MANKMLIDASHPEETRVVVVRGNRVEEFDFESASRRQLRGNIYLAKVTRVEPSLQAAFVDYGGNRHGFLAFSEIHPDYYQIPVADRQALIEAERREADEAEERQNAREERDRRGRRRGASARAAAGASEEADVGGEGPEPEANNGQEESSAAFIESVEPASESPWHEAEEAAVPEAQLDEGTEVDEEGEGAADDNGGPAMPAATPRDPSVSAPAEALAEESGDERPFLEGAPSTVEDVSEGDNPEEDAVESVGAEDAMEEVPERRRGRARQYKIQEVIKRRQVLLVQVVKEERGNKGAALTTYLSLAGRYSVLMPNTARGGGISRKITSITDRKRLKQVAADLEVPEGMGVILRTAGASRTRAEVKRDFEYLLRLWENVRELTLRSTAPTLVYEEGSLIKRSIRDLYNKDIDEVLVAGDDGYREAKDFMRMLMPSHAKNVQPYREAQPLFARNSIEAQLDAMFSPQVTLRSGGYIVINQTEALVSIDVNSGRSTREHNIEDTALQTNLEAAEEVARQLRLRDLAGLIVIDFIDMEEKRNNRSVEKRLKDCLKNDRARIQVGRISHFGLLEMSRQRIRTGVVESTTDVCPHCQGTGHIRAPSSVSLHVLRSLEENLLRGATHNLTIRTKTPVALYILNQKRGHLAELESRFGISITVVADDSVSSGSHFTLERGEAVTGRTIEPTTIQPTSVTPARLEPEAEAAIDAGEEGAEAAEAEADDEPAKAAEHGPREQGADERRRRRRRRRGGRRDGGSVEGAEPTSRSIETAADDERGPAPEERTGGRMAEGEADRGRRRRRGRRGGRRGDRRENGSQSQLSDDAVSFDGESAGRVERSVAGDESRSPAQRPVDQSGGESRASFGREPESAPRDERPSEAASAPERREPPEDPNAPKRGGWWQRRGFF